MKRASIINHRMRILVLAGAVALLPLLGVEAQAEERFGPNDIHTLFMIDKSNDHNRVEYGIRLDANCVPREKDPVYAYWRQIERGPDVTDDLNFNDRTVYGIKFQHLVPLPGGGTRVVIGLRATSNRSVAIDVRKDGGVCAADSTTFISATPAKLHLIHVELAGPLSVKWIELRGTRTDNGQPIVERVKP